MTNSQLHDQVIQDLHAYKYTYRLGDEVICRENGRFFDRIIVGIIYKVYDNSAWIEAPDGKLKLWFFFQMRPRPHTKENMRFLLRIV